MSLDELRNIGAASRAMLREAGIETEVELRALGAAHAYRKVRFHCGRHVSLNLLWALHGALNGCDWRNLDAETKAALKRDAGV